MVKYACTVITEQFAGGQDINLLVGLVVTLDFGQVCLLTEQYAGGKVCNLQVGTIVVTLDCGLKGLLLCP